MSVQTITLLLALFFALSIILSQLRKINMGVMGLGFAILLAGITGLKWKDITASFPSGVVVSIFAVALFFGTYAQNGTLEWLASKLAGILCRNPKFIPFGFFILPMVLAAIGGCDMVVFAAAICFPLGKAAGMKPYYTGCTLMLGAMTGSYLPWSLHGSTASSIIVDMLDGAFAESMTGISWGMWFTAVVVYLILIVVYYFAFKGYKLHAVDIKKAEAATAKQKTSLIIILIAFIVIVFVPILSKSVGGIFKTWNKFAGVAPVFILGSIVNGLLNLADQKEIIKKRIPWNTISILMGMGMLLNLGSKLGVNDYLGEIAASLPTIAIVPFFVLLAGGLSLFSSSLSVVYPLLFPIAGALALNGSVTPVAAMAAVLIGSATTAMSPLSTGGALMLSGCPDDIAEGNEIFTGMIVMAVVSMILLVILGFIGFFGLWGIL